MSIPDKIIISFVALLAAGQLSAQTVTIRFDNTGSESGVTSPGTSDFSFMGSNWSGGNVFTLGQFSLYASDSFAYNVSSGSAMVTFDQPVIDVGFFYVHRSGVSAPGMAIAFNAAGDELGTVNSNQATSFGDSTNFVGFDTTEPISRIEFTNGVVDNFSYTVTEEEQEEPFVFDFNLADGNWLNPDPDFAGSNQGPVFDFGPTFPNLLFMTWFTYTSTPMMPSDDPPMDVGAPDQRWFSALLEIEGNSATGMLIVNEGGEFAAPKTMFQRAREAGTFTVEFTACDRGTVTYTIDQPALSGEFEIIPLEKAVNPNGFSCEPSADG